MNRVFILSLFLSSVLFAGTIHMKMDERIKGQSYLGNKTDYTASKDGLGIIPLQHHSGTTIINSELKVQKKLVELMRKTEDVSRLSNIKESLNFGEIGSTKDKEFVYKLDSTISSILPSEESTTSESEEVLPPLTSISVSEMLSKPQANVQFVAGIGYGSNMTNGNFLNYSGLVDNVSFHYADGLYFSDHVDGSAISFARIIINDKSRLWVLPAYQSYDSDIVISKKNITTGLFEELPNVAISSKGRNSQEFYITSTFLEPGEYLFQRSETYSTQLPSDPYKGLRADAKWFFEKY